MKVYIVTGYIDYGQDCGNKQWIVKGFIKEISANILTDNLNKLIDELGKKRGQRRLIPEIRQDLYILDPQYEDGCDYAYEEVDILDYE